MICPSIRVETVEKRFLECHCEERSNLLTFETGLPHSPAAACLAYDSPRRAGSFAMTIVSSCLIVIACRLQF